MVGDERPLPAFGHAALWQAIDTLAAEHGLSPSGLAREAGLDATAFNPSKRRDSRTGAARWPTLETLSRVLGATSTTLESFARLVAGARTLPATGQGAQAAAAAPPGRVPMLPIERLGRPGLFDAGGHPQGAIWQDIELPAPAAPGCYVVQLETGWAPAYRPRTLLIVDPEAVLRSGDLALRYDTAGVRPVTVTDPAQDGFAPIGAADEEAGTGSDAVVFLRLHRIVWASQ